MKETIKLSIIIPVFNALNFTKICLENLKGLINNVESKPHNINIVVVDDGSKDGTGEWIQKNHPDVSVLKGDGSLWWSGGINKGMLYAFTELGSEYVLWWNNDIEAREDYLNNLINHLKAEQGANVLGSKIYIKSNNLVWSMGGYFNPKSGKKGMYGFQQPDDGSFSQTMMAEWLPGMGTIISKDVFKAIGIIDDKSFPQYHGDVEYTYRARLNGFQIKVHPDLIIFNDKSNSGVSHNDNFKDLKISLTSLRSNYNISKDVLFYRKFCTSLFAYQDLISKYGKYIGGFLKWKVLSILGLKRKP